MPAEGLDLLVDALNLSAGYLEGGMGNDSLEVLVQKIAEPKYNGPPVKTTLSEFIVNQIFPILTLAASRATPFVQAAVSRLRQQVALTGRWWPVTLLPLRGAYT